MSEGDQEPRGWRQRMQVQRDEASTDISDWLAGRGRMVPAVVVLLVVVAFVVVIFWTG